MNSNHKEIEKALSEIRVISKEIRIYELESWRVTLRLICLLMPAFFAALLFLQTKGMFVDNSIFSFSFRGYIFFAASCYSMFALIAYLLVEYTESNINKLKKEIKNVDNKKK